jgi:hypothetical protein
MKMETQAKIDGTKGQREQTRTKVAETKADEKKGRREKDRPGRFFLFRSCYRRSGGAFLQG